MRRMTEAVAAVVAVMLCAASAAAVGASTSQLQVRIVTGHLNLPAGSVVELRIHETGRALARYPLTHGEAWPAGSTRVIPVALPEPLDPAAVTRFGIYYRPPTAGGPWEIANAQVSAITASGGSQSIGTVLAGAIRPGDELATVDRDGGGVCRVDADCDDGRMCNGQERCAPGARGADVRGCVAGTPMTCPVNQVCVEGGGCRGVGSAGAAAASAGFGGDLPVTGATAPTAPASDSAAVANQHCLEGGVSVTAADGSVRKLACPHGTVCVNQPNGAGVCVPAGH
jgi:hypothetical protein